ncbi:hypothetical protein WA026_004349 [Henosepilachna vigintioctopunctata]|uniref:Carboxylesterase type B domain-containing protein n=1 Tax=Henosepilachna vigintioctopunctata TaxID=420089 RepID=A0AAW1V096_9CUCU
MKSIFLHKIYVALLVKYSMCWGEVSPRVQLRQGNVEGFFSESLNVRIFCGIPYAAPPVGSLRFAAPRIHQGWNGTYQAIRSKPGCPQLPLNSENEKEDCLYLDIWAPKINSSYKFPVVVYIGGVDFARDTKWNFSGQDLASRGFIVVKVTYRLNIFGFFCLGIPEFRGNLGLLDQYYALLWVKENIVHFGGNKENITLFGHCSGASSVSLHMTSPRTYGLFQKAVLSSGSATAPWITDNDTIQVSKQLVRILRCDANTMDCLRGKSVHDLLQALQMYSESMNRTDLLVPTVDSFLKAENRYLPLSAEESFREGTYLQIPSLIGVGKPIRNPKIDGWISLLSQGYFFLQKFVERVKIPELVKLYRLNEKLQELIAHLIKWEYSLFIDTDGGFLIKQLEKMEYEAKLEVPVFHQISYMGQLSRQPTYAYSVQDMDFISDVLDESITMDMILFMGPASARQISKKRFTARELHLSKHLQDYLVNFIIFGNPTPYYGKNTWRRFIQHDPYVEVIENFQKSENGRIQRKRISFWNDLLIKFSDIQYNNMQSSISVEMTNTAASSSSFRNVILCGLLSILLLLLVLCIILLRKKSKLLRSNTSWTLD